MTDEKKDREQISATIKDREVMFYLPTEGQGAMLIRFSAAAQRAGEGPGVVDAIARMLDVLIALVVEPEDKLWLDDGMISGEIDLDDMGAPFQEMIASQAANAEAAPKNGPKSATRGRR